MRSSGGGTTGGNVTLGSNMLTVGSGSFAGAISGSVSLTISGGGTLILTNSNSSFTGEMTIASGTLQLGDGTTNGAVGGIIIDNSSLIFDPGSAGLTFSKSISGSGSVTKNGGNTLTFAGGTSGGGMIPLITTQQNTYSGGTTINDGGILQVTSSGGGLPSGSNLARKRRDFHPQHSCIANLGNRN